MNYQTPAVKMLYVASLIIKLHVAVQPILKEIPKILAYELNVPTIMNARLQNLVLTQNVSIHAHCPTVVDKMLNVRQRIMLEFALVYLVQLVIHC